MTRPVALLDANVFPTTWLLDILLTLDEYNLIDAVWSERILGEVRCTLVERQRRKPAQAERFLDAIRSMNPTHCAYGWEPREALQPARPRRQTRARLRLDRRRRLHRHLQPQGLPQDQLD